MSADAPPRPRAIGRLDAAIDRLLAIAGDGPGADPSERLRVFEGLVLVHLVATVASGAFSRTNVEPWMQGTAAAVLAGSLLVTVVTRLRRFAPLAVAVAFCTMLALQRQIFPETGNHSFLELWILIALLAIGRSTRDENVVLLSTFRWLTAIMLFYTGLQKLVYGTYFEAQFLASQIAIKSSFADVFGLIVSSEELARMKELPLFELGGGPIRGQGTLLLLASNAVYGFELTAPALLLWRRTRRAATVALLLFTVLIQFGAREIFFGVLLVNLTLLFWPTDLHSRLRWGFVGAYGAMAATRLLLPEVLLR